MFFLIRLMIWGSFSTVQWDCPINALLLKWKILGGGFWAEKVSFEHRSGTVFGRHSLPRLDSDRLGLAQLGWAQLGLAQIGAAWANSVGLGLGLARLCSARFGPSRFAAAQVWFGTARPGSIRRGLETFQICPHLVPGGWLEKKNCRAHVAIDFSSPPSFFAGHFALTGHSPITYGIRIRQFSIISRRSVLSIHML